MLASRSNRKSSDMKFTVDTYCHWMPGKNREAMDRLPSLVG